MLTPKAGVDIEFLRESQTKTTTQRLICSYTLLSCVIRP
jgi:hypothetical protein